nr:hypothetical protein [Nocardia sp. NRRL S-836]
MTQDVVVVDGDVGLGRVQVVVSKQFCGDVHRQTGGDGFSGEDPPEVVWRVAEQVSVGADQLGALDGELEQAVGSRRAHDADLGAMAALEQVR